MGDDFGHLGACDAVIFCRLQVINQRGVGKPLRDEGRDGDKAAVAQRKQIVAAPYFAEKDVVVKMGEFRSELAEGVAPGCLDNLLLRHNIRI